MKFQKVTSRLCFPSVFCRGCNPFEQIPEYRGLTNFENATVEGMEGVSIARCFRILKQ